MLVGIWYMEDVQRNWKSRLLILNEIFGQVDHVLHANYFDIRFSEQKWNSSKGW